MKHLLSLIVTCPQPHPSSLLISHLTQTPQIYDILLILLDQSDQPPFSLACLEVLASLIQSDDGYFKRPANSKRALDIVCQKC